MKKHYIVISTIIAIAIVFFGVSINNVKASENLKPTEHTIEIFYVLKDYNGRIALFESNNQAPIKVFDIFTRSLPEKDAKNIINGIRVNSNDIEKILEEYVS